MAFSHAYSIEDRHGSPAHHVAVITAMLEAAPVCQSQLSGGRNSRIYKVDFETGRSCIAKFYHRHPADPRDRLDTEYRCLEFLKRHRVSNVAQPLARDDINQCAIYEYIEGRIMPPESITTGDVEALVRFLKTLDGLKNLPQSDRFKRASEACLCPMDMLANLDMRFKALARVNPAASAVHLKLAQFLSRELMPFYDKIKQERLRHKSPRGPWERDKTLSPSDVGFHNALKTHDGKWYFIDFEYFGWDDPAKMICDVLLHPAAGLSRELRKYFLRRILEAIEFSSGLRERIQTVFPFLALKWCAILLNEFIPNRMSRRRFAGNTANDAKILYEQYEKARNMFALAKEARDVFPYES